MLKVAKPCLINWTPVYLMAVDLCKNRDSMKNESNIEKVIKQKEIRFVFTIFKYANDVFWQYFRQLVIYL